MVHVCTQTCGVLHEPYNEVYCIYFTMWSTEVEIRDVSRLECGVLYEPQEIVYCMNPIWCGV